MHGECECALNACVHNECVSERRENEGVVNAPRVFVEFTIVYRVRGCSVRDYMVSESVSVVTTVVM